MLKTIGVSSVEELFSDIKPELRAKSFNLKDGKSEFEVFEHLENLSKKNSFRFVNFIGGGFYDHFIPSVVDALSSRSEFYTNYTPYQAECAQGTLQALYEYQTAICRITGMDAANASLYDGGTALAEAVLMALRITNRNKVIIDGSVHPFYREIVHTYTANLPCDIVEINPVHYIMDTEKIKQILDNETAAIVFQNPNFFGSIYDYSDIVRTAHSNGIMTVASVYPVSLGLLKTPFEMGVDIATGEGQSMGNPLNFGGPYLGFIATLKNYIRKLPGRIAGETIDKDGKKGFVLTLQAREQHIKRERATSNICTNQNLCALRAIIYLTSLGKQGFKEVAKQNYDKANYAKEILSEINSVTINNSQPIFNEFVLRFESDAEEIYIKMLQKGFFAGIPLGKFYTDMENDLLVCVTEKIKKDKILAFRDALQEIMESNTHELRTQKRK